MTYIISLVWDMQLMQVSALEIVKNEGYETLILVWIVVPKAGSGVLET